ncbi:MAG: flagellar motor switch protein FliG [Hoeflea sp.]|uniref:flagellar motor switch protein FliG n=1 Tax=Hoeflea sp. TaxID=1940281 RepID=UPI001DBB4F9B|nr:flagellar motor switch protein FliG [Hoeflea sp.]MBU4531137.1 flagellar motor switch protein FliG [Alphaproteobacteria bacterium]MBU4545801.1 flagellar motor switch protein FliG [Alphaproteobacteria bacterium]MBU4550770.1 flagellar motor switch protein FliG [Alphaproteobacteria bacterium]MBV1724414.1 flagellar motor switch protein FliG [Hoeflea sp.]MBV1760434.1 flagellar motor switch protein FliG [Hoeflea sp.]
MTLYSEFDPGNAEAGSSLTPSEKAAAVLLAMGKPVAGKLLKFFEYEELQEIIKKAQNLRTIKPQELIELVNEFEDLFSEGTGLMDNAKAMEGILEEGLTPDEVDGLLGRRTQFESYETSVWDRLQDSDPDRVGRFLQNEHPQTAAYIVSMLPTGFAGKTLMRLPEQIRVDIIRRAVELKSVNPRAAEIIEARVRELVAEMEAEKANTGSVKVAEIMNELSKPDVESLLGALETVSKSAVAKVRPRIFLFDDIILMPQRSRVTLLNDISGDIITTALRGADNTLRESLLSAIGARQRRMIESDLAAGDGNVSVREIAIARRTIAQEAIRLAGLDQLTLRDENAPAPAAAEAKAA